MPYRELLSQDEIIVAQHLAKVMTAYGKIDKPDINTLLRLSFYTLAELVIGDIGERRTV